MLSNLTLYCLNSLRGWLFVFYVLSNIGVIIGIVLEEVKSREKLGLRVLLVSLIFELGTGFLSHRIDDRRDDIKFGAWSLSELQKKELKQNVNLAAKDSRDHLYNSTSDIPHFFCLKAPWSKVVADELQRILQLPGTSPCYPEAENPELLPDLAGIYVVYSKKIVDKSKIPEAAQEMYEVLKRSGIDARFGLGNIEGLPDYYIAVGNNPLSVVDPPRNDTEPLFVEVQR